MNITIRAVGPAVDIVRRHYHIDHLHESSWSMDFASNPCLFHGIIRFHFITVGSIITAANIRLFFRLVSIEGVTP